MDIQRVTLRDIVNFRPRELSNEVWNKIPLEAAGGLLHIRLLDVIHWAWKKGRELEAYRDTEKYPPDKSFSVSLVEHTIKSIHEPHVEIRMNQKKVGSVHFLVKLEITIRAMKLEIKNARIEKIKAGDWNAKGSFFCEGFLLAKRESNPLDLPGTVDLGEGLEI